MQNIEKMNKKNEKVLEEIQSSKVDISSCFRTVDEKWMKNMR